LYKNRNNNSYVKNKLNDHAIIIIIINNNNNNNNLIELLAHVFS